MWENDTSKDTTPTGDIKPGRKQTGKKPPKKITQKYLYNSGLAYLQRFPTSVPHFKRVMQRKIDRSCKFHNDQSPEECSKFLQEVVEIFLRQGLLNDDAFLSGMVNSYRRRGLSTLAILSKLQQKGFSASVIAQTLQNHDDENNVKDNEFRAALMLVRRKKIGAYRNQQQEFQSKDMGVMARAGFGFDVARKALTCPPETLEEYLSDTQY